MSIFNSAFQCKATDNQELILLIFGVQLKNITFYLISNQTHLKNKNKKNCNKEKIKGIEINNLTNTKRTRFRECLDLLLHFDMLCKQFNSLKFVSELMNNNSFPPL